MEKKLDLVRLKSANVAELLKTLAHPARLMILCYLADGEKTVSELEELSEISQSQVSQFLKRMQAEKLVDYRKDGKFVYYRLVDQRIMKLMKSLYGIFCECEE